MHLYIGHTRFSLFQPGSTNWRASEEGRFSDEEAYRRYLYAPKRLDVRISIFLGMTVPQLAIAAKGKEVHHIVSFSSSLPDQYKQKLRDSAQKYPFLVLDECSESDQPLTPESYVRTIVRPGTSHIYAEYRLDDDDVLPCDYYEQIAPYLHSSFVGMYVSLGEGLTAVYRDGHFYDARRCHSPKLAIGLAKICSIDAAGRIQMPPAERHTVVDTVAPVVLDSRRLGFIWARHPDQDTAVGAAAVSTRSELFERARRQIAHFPVEHDMGLVAEQFPTISDRIHTDAGPGRRQFPVVSSRTRVPSRGVQIATPRLQGKCTFQISIRASTMQAGRDVLLSLQLEDDEGESVSPTEYGDKLKASGLTFSSMRNIGFCKYISTRPGLRKEEFVIDLPPEVSIAGIAFYPRKGVDARLEVEHLTILEE